MKGRDFSAAGPPGPNEGQVEEEIELGEDLVIDDPEATPMPERMAMPRMAVPEEDDVHQRITADQSGRVDTLRTAEINLERDRRDTLTSPISALIARSMQEVSEIAARDPAAPRPEGHHDLTRRVGDSDRAPTPRDSSRGNRADLSNDPNARPRMRAAHLVDQARALMQAGALAGAVVAAEQALDEAERAAPPGIAEVIEPARPLFAQVFSAYVGSLDEVPVMAKRLQDISPLGLDDRRRAFLSHVDGVRTIAQIFDAARFHSSGSEGLRIAASLLRAGIIRVV